MRWLRHRLRKADSRASDDAFTPWAAATSAYAALRAARLEAREIDVVIAFPDNVAGQIQSGQQATIDVLYDELDPIERSWLDYYAYVQTNELNRRIVLEILQRQPQENLTAAALAGGGGDLSSALVGGADKPIPPSVLVSPFRASSSNMAPTTPDYVAFYAPGVLALLVQHIAVTLTALALVRERLLGAVELFRVSPVRPGEMIAGKYLSYFLQTAVFAALLVVLMAYGLDIPFLGDPVWLVAVLVLLIAASLSVGFLISALSRSETQAVQFSMLVLLASVFFSGFFLPLDNLLPAVRPLSYALPVTYGVQGLQDLMLRGAVPAQWIMLALGGIALLAALAATWTFRRGFRPE
mgnify:CR=1 FL=1